MNGKASACLLAAGSLVLIGCAAGPGSQRNGGEPAASAVVATSTEQTLQAALNAERRRMGKSGLTTSSILSGLARRESDAAAGQLAGESADRLRSRSGFGSIGRLRGQLKDRGAGTGAEFVTYWVKGDREMLLDDWSHMGTGVSKSADGRLFAVVIFGGGAGGGGSLMNPAMAPGGFMTR